MAETPVAPDIDAALDRLYGPVGQPAGGGDEIDAAMDRLFGPLEGPGVMGWATELGKSAVAGAVGTVGSMARGTEQMLKVPTNETSWNAAWEMFAPAGARVASQALGDVPRDVSRHVAGALTESARWIQGPIAGAVADAAPGLTPDVDPYVRQSLAGQVAQGVGSSVPFIATGLAGAPAGPWGMAAAAAGGGMLAEGGAAYERVRLEGGTETEAVLAMLGAAPAGTLEAVTAAPWGGQFLRVLTRAGRASRGGLRSAMVAAEAAEKAAQGGALRTGRNLLLSAGGEGGTEYVQGGWGELVNQAVRGEEDLEAVFQAAKSGFLPAAISGGLIQGGMLAAQRLTGERAQGPLDATTPEGGPALEESELDDETFTAIQRVAPKFGLELGAVVEDAAPAPDPAGSGRIRTESEISLNAPAEGVPSAPQPEVSAAPQAAQEAPGSPLPADAPDAVRQESAPSAPTGGPKRGVVRAAPERVQRVLGRYGLRAVAIRSPDGKPLDRPAVFIPPAKGSKGHGALVYDETLDESQALEIGLGHEAVHALELVDPAAAKELEKELTKLLGAQRAHARTKDVEADYTAAEGKGLTKPALKKLISEERRTAISQDFGGAFAEAVSRPQVLAELFQGSPGIARAIADVTRKMLRFMGRATGETWAEENAKRIQAWADSIGLAKDLKPHEALQGARLIEKAFRGMRTSPGRPVARLTPGPAQRGEAARQTGAPSAFSSAEPDRGAEQAPEPDRSILRQTENADLRHALLREAREQTVYQGNKAENFGKNAGLLARLDLRGYDTLVDAYAGGGSYGMSLVRAGLAPGIRRIVLNEIEPVKLRRLEWSMTRTGGQEIMNTLRNSQALSGIMEKAADAGALGRGSAVKLYLDKINFASDAALSLDERAALMALYETTFSGRNAHWAGILRNVERNADKVYRLHRDLTARGVKIDTASFDSMTGALWESSPSGRTVVVADPPYRATSTATYSHRADSTESREGLQRNLSALLPHLRAGATIIYHNARHPDVVADAPGILGAPVLTTTWARAKKGAADAQEEYLGVFHAGAGRADVGTGGAVGGSAGSAQGGGQGFGMVGPSGGHPAGSEGRGAEGHAGGSGLGGVAGLLPSRAISLRGKRPSPGGPAIALPTRMRESPGELRQVYVGDTVRVDDREGRVVETTGSGNRQRAMIQYEGGDISPVTMRADVVEIVQQKRGAQATRGLSQAERARRKQATEERAEGADPRFATRRPLPRTITVDGVERPTTNSNGKPIAQTEDALRNFWRWFGESKVVDDDGRPRVVYHGTESPGFTAFDKAKTGSATDSGYLGSGFYFGDTFEGSVYGHRGAVFPVYLSMQNPLVLRERQHDPGLRESGTYTGDREYHVREALGLSTEKRGAAYAVTPSQVTKGAAGQGFDGVSYSRPGDDMEFVVFEPTQIKSAIGNSGAFDPKNQDIRYATRRPLPRIVQEAKQAIETGEQPHYATTSAGKIARAMRVAAERQVMPETISNAEIQRAARELLGTKAGRDAVEAAVLSGELPGDPKDAATYQVAAERLAQNKLDAVARNMEEGAAVKAVSFHSAYARMRGSAGRQLQAVKNPTTPKESLNAEMLEPTRLGAIRLADLERRLADANTIGQKQVLQRKIDQVQRMEARFLLKGLKALRDAGWDPEKITEAELIANPPLLMMLTRRFNAARSSGWDKLVEFRVSNMVSNLRSTVFVNPGTAMMNGLYSAVVRRAVQAALPMKGGAGWGELKAMLDIAPEAMRAAGHNAWQYLKTDTPQLDPMLKAAGVTDEGAGSREQFEGRRGAAIPGKIGRLIRGYGLTPLAAGDELTRTLFTYLEAAAQAHRLSGGDKAAAHAMLTDFGDKGVWRQATQLSRRYAFMDSDKATLTGEATQKALELRHFVDRMAARIPTGPPLGTLGVPFLGTPVNVFAQGVRIPLAPLIALGHVVRGDWKGNPDLRAADVADTIISLSLAIAAAEVLSWRDEDGIPYVTGSGPAEWNGKRFDETVAPPLSMRLGGKTWRSYGRLDPFATAIASIVDAIQSDGNPLEILQGLVTQMQDKTFLRGLGDMLDAVQNPESGKAARLVRSMTVDTMVPLGAKTLIQSADPYVRADPTRGPDAWEHFWGGFAAQFDPEDLPQIYDHLGRPVKRKGQDYTGRALSIAPETLDADTVSRVDKAVFNWNEDAEKPWYPAPIARRISDASDEEWSPEQYAELTRIAGEGAAKLLARRRFDHVNPTERDIDMIQDALTTSRRRAKQQMLRERRKVAR